MIKLSEESFVSIGLVVIIAGGVWGAAITHSVASNAYAKATELAARQGIFEVEMERRRELNDDFKNQVVSDLAVIKSHMGIKR